MNTVCEQQVDLSHNVASIQSSAIKVFVSISQWSGRKKDKAASEKVTSDNQAKRGRASVNKSLLGDSEELRAIQKLVGQVRNHHIYQLTLPWDDAGWRLLTTPLIPDFFKMMTGLQNEFYQLVESFLNAYQLEVAQEQAALGTLFNADDYPSVEELRSKFRFIIDKEPIPDSGDWRVDIGNQGLQELAEETSKRNNERVDKVMKEVWERLYEALSNLSDKIDYADHEQKKIFKASTVDKLHDLIGLLDAFNVTNDPQLTLLRRNLEDAMRGVTPEALREDGGLRLDTKKKLDEAMKSLPSLM